MNNAPLKYLLVVAGTLLLLRLLMRVAGRIGLVDYPGRRKRHRGAIPLIGGPAIFGGMAFGALLIADTLYPYRALFAALSVLLVAGILDDLRDLTPRQKFGAQLVAALFIVSWGQMSVQSVGDLFGLGEILLRSWALPFTIVCLLGVINAINMADGADGLAAGLSLIALTLLAISASIAGQLVTAQLLSIIIAAALAFWVVNMRFPWQPHARAFLGDSGSMMLGLLLTWFCIETARGGPEGLPPIVAVWFLAIPLLDMGVVIVRRLARGHNPFHAGRDHFHHMLIAAGLTPGQAVLAILLLSLVLGTAAFQAWRIGVPDHRLFYAFIGLFSISILVSWNWRRLLIRGKRMTRTGGARSSGRSR
jgi:UDP-GlcNAc:undecaprenyl-phosphate GlcNAc-1-phosphate transferase